MPHYQKSTAMRGYTDDNGDGTIENITKSIHIHPALSEVVARAAAPLVLVDSSLIIMINKFYAT